MYADTVWNRNKSRIAGIIGGISYGYRLEDNFKREAQNKFYENFERYYEDDDSYLKFFYACLSNLAKNRVKAKARDLRNISSVMSDDGEETCIYDAVNIEDNSMQSELFINEINGLMKDSLGELEFFVYEHLLEGWSTNEISQMLEVSPARVYDMRSGIGKKLKGYL